MKKTAVVGAGKMGSAIFNSLRKKFPKKVFLCDRKSDLNKILPKTDIVIFAVKPQDFDACAHSISVDLSNKLIISIMAGIKIGHIKKNTLSKKIIRSMPNLALRVSHSITAWIATPDVDKKTAKEIFSCFGRQIEVKDERKLDSITALSGSGPAYFFLICELLERAANSAGFDPKAAKQIAESTFIGAAKMLEQSGESALKLREEITSKGGTTEAALKSLESKNFSGVFQSAIDAATNRFKK